MISLRRLPWKVFIPSAVLGAAAILVWWVLIGPAILGEYTSGEPTPTEQIELVETPRPNEWSALAAESDPSSVAIQTFRGGAIVRSGTGTAVSSDGLIVTVADVVPVTSPSASYQVTMPSQVLRAVVVRRDVRTNLALLKVDANDLSVAQMTQTRPLVGTPLAVVGGLVNVSAYTPYFSHAWMAYDLSRYAILDTAFVTTLAGGRAITPDGKQVGMVFLRSGRVHMLWTEQALDFIESYLLSLESAQ